MRSLNNQEIEWQISYKPDWLITCMVLMPFSILFKLYGIFYRPIFVLGVLFVSPLQMPKLHVEGCQGTCRAHMTLMFDLAPTCTNASNGTSTHDGEQLCQIILKSIHKCRSYGLHTHTHAHAHAHTHTHTPTKLSFWQLCLIHCKWARQKFNSYKICFLVKRKLLYKVNSGSKDFQKRHSSCWTSAFKKVLVLLWFLFVHHLINSKWKSLKTEISYLRFW